MFGNKLADAQARIGSLMALVAVTGFKLEASAAIPAPEALAAHLESAQKSATDSAVASALAPVLAASEQAQASSRAYAAGLAAAGVKLGEFTAADFALAEGAAENAATAAVKTAVETAITARAAKQIAATGHPHALDIKPGEEPATATSAELKTHYDTLTDASARAAFYARHKSKLLS